jgi:hypothetical protein
MHVRIVSAVVLLLVLAPSWAAAGCAWVLWQQEPDGRWDLEKGSVRLAFDTRR